MLGGLRGLGAVEEGVVDVGPEFFDDEGERVDADVRAPLGAEVSDRALAAGVVSGGDRAGCARAEDFADVEGFIAGIVPGDDDAGDGIPGALPEAAAAEGVIAIVLVGNSRDDAFDEEVLDGLIGSGMPEVATVGDAAGTEFGIVIFCEAVAGEG